MLKLKREVGLFGATAYILGIIVGAGIYVIIGEAAGITGNTLWLSFLIAAFIAACTGLSYAELSSTFPYDSAEYIYTERAFRDRRFSFGIGWLKLVTLVIASAAVALGFGGYLAWITGWNFILCALLLIGVLTLINLLGVKKALTLDITLVMIAVAGLLIVIIAGIPQLHEPSFYLEMPNGIGGLMSAAALIFFAYLGFEGIGNLGEEVRNPKKNLPRALIISVLISTVIYLLVALVSVSVVPWNELGHSASPLSTVLASMMGTKAGLVISIMALAATGSTVLGLMIGGSRMIYGLAEEHSFPKLFLRLSKKRRVPYIAVITVSIVSAIFVLPGNISAVAFLTDFGALFMFMIINLCVIVLRYSHHHIPRGFRIPLNIGRFPVVAAVGMVSCGALLFSFEKKLFLGGILIFLFGILLYTMFGGKEKETLRAPRKRRPWRVKPAKAKPVVGPATMTHTSVRVKQERKRKEAKKDKTKEKKTKARAKKTGTSKEGKRRSKHTQGSKAKKKR